MKVAITGATGFVGRALCQHLDQQQIEHTALGRSTDSQFNCIEVDYKDPASLIKRLDGHDTLIHLIGKTHSVDSIAQLDDYRNINVALTLRVAEAAFDAGVQHFIYISSIKANGEGGDTAYDTQSKPAPTTAYGISKWEAEQALIKLCAKRARKLTIFRPPLIYDKNAKGNIATLLKAMKLGLPLPFKSIDNRRSLISLHDLCNLIIQEASSNDPKPLILPVSHTCSTAELIQKIGRDHEMTPRLLGLPPALLKGLLTLLGRKKDIDKLCGNLTVTPTPSDLT